MSIYALLRIIRARRIPTQMSLRKITLFWKHIPLSTYILGQDGLWRERT